MRKACGRAGPPRLSSSPAALRAEGVAIDHRTVGCVVAGKYPRLNACFAPRSGLARARVYFRVADAPPDWYYVEMASDAPCHAGILPRPKKELVGRRIQYYVDAFDRSFTESRTPEAEALVVASASECNSKLPVAPILNSATVAVFPGLPAGFAAAPPAWGPGPPRRSRWAAPRSWGAGWPWPPAATRASGSHTHDDPAAGGGAAHDDGTDDDHHHHHAGRRSFNPDFKVFDGATLLSGDTIVGTEPLVLRFDMCDSTGPYPMRYAVEVDGVIETNGCNSFVTFTTVSASSDVQGAAVRRSATARTYAVRMTIQSAAPNNEPKANRRLTVQVNPCDEPPPADARATRRARSSR